MIKYVMDLISIKIFYIFIKTKKNYIIVILNDILIKILLLENI